MDEQPLVSIIVTVFNKHDHLGKSLRSLFAQTYPNIEIIVVDDNSSDNSSECARQLLRNHDNSHLICNKTNVGLLKSRYIGIEHAQGLYTAFVDADDWMESKAIATMVNTLQSLRVDLVQVRHQRRMKGMAVKYQEKFDALLANRTIEGDEFRNLASYVGMDSYIYPACWGKLYITSKLRETTRLDFNQFWGEDQIFNIQYLRECKSMAFTDYVGYNYRWGGETTSIYKYSAIKEYKYVHQLKRILGQDEASINREICMLLRYYIRSLITELGYTKEAVEMVIDEELKDPLWKQVGMTMETSLLIEREYTGIQKNPIKYLAKRLLH